jgi:hypothetical protein
MALQKAEQGETATMQSQQRRAILAAALNVGPGRDPSRDTVEAAIWALTGPAADESRVASLLAVVDAYSDARSRRAAAAWARRVGAEPPPAGNDIAQFTSVLRSIERLAPRSRLASQSLPGPCEPAEVIQLRPAVAAAGSESKSDDEVWRELRASFTTSDAFEEPERGREDEDEDEDGGAEPLYRCRKCDDPKPEGDYYRSKSTARGFSYTCKICHGARNKAYRDRKKTHGSEGSSREDDGGDEAGVSELIGLPA